MQQQLVTCNTGLRLKATELEEAHLDPNLHFFAMCLCLTLYAVILSSASTLLQEL